MKTRTQTKHRTRATFVPVLFILALACAALAAPAPAKRTATHGGVRVTFDVTLAREATGQTVPASPLEDASEKPDGVYPEHVALTLVGMRDAPEGSVSEPVIRVCPVAEYLKAFSVSPDNVKYAERTFAELRGLLRRRPRALKGNVPQLPLLDATEVFHARVKYLRFSGGSGVAYLTQAQQDDQLLNSQQVTYSFRGLTDDGRFYVTADLPVGASALAATRDAGSHEGYALPTHAAGAAEGRRYSNYVERVRRKLERLTPEQFGPSLRLYDELLSSLEIRK